MKIKNLRTMALFLCGFAFMLMSSNAMSCLNKDCGTGYHCSYASDQCEVNPNDSQNIQVNQPKTINPSAVDMGVLQEQCAGIGFKIKTPANGACVLRLIKVVNAQAAQQQQQTLQVQQAAQVQQEQEQHAATVSQQQAEMYALQRRAVVAQEQAASAQKEAVNNQKSPESYFTLDRLINVLNATGKIFSAYGESQRPLALPPGASYYPHQQTTTCRTYGNQTTCQQSP